MKLLRVLLWLAWLQVSSVALQPACGAYIRGEEDSFPGWLGSSHEALEVRRPFPSPAPFDRSRVIQLSPESPRVYPYRGFLSEECDHIIGLAIPTLERSKVVASSTGPGKVSETRTSSGSFIQRGADIVMRRIERRIEEWTFLPVPNQEPLQVLRYYEGQKYVPHVDYFPDDAEKQAGGQRYATVLMYLSNVTMGGETVFTNVPDPTAKEDTWSECAQGQLAVKPRKGDALLFFNMHPDGTPDPMSMHYACPVIKGIKWSAPKWIHVRGYGIPLHDPTLCHNSHYQCDYWAATGECLENPDYMEAVCRKACGTCS